MISMPYLQIQLPSDFNIEECLWFLDRNFDECIYRIEGNSVLRALKIKDEKLLLQIEFEKNHLNLYLLVGQWNPETEEFIRNFVAHWFDAETDLAPFYENLNKIDSLRYMMKDFASLRLVSMPDLFETLCWCIIGQQINLKFAFTIKRRLVEYYGDFIMYKGEKFYLFPTPEILQDADPILLRGMQFSMNKVKYLINISTAFTSGEISAEKLLALPNYESRQKMLTAVKGIGVWTANYTLMKGLKERNCIPYGDAGLLNALLNHQLIQDKKDNKGFDEIFAKFKGWESYLVFYLWRSLAPKN